MNTAMGPGRGVGRLARMHEPSRGWTVRCGRCGHHNAIPWSRIGHVVRCGSCSDELSGGDRPIAIDGAGLDELIRSAGVPVVVDFWSRHRGGSRTPAEFDTVAARADGRYVAVKIDTDEHPHVAARHGLEGDPIVAVFADGKELARNAKADTATAMVEFVDRTLASRLPRMSMLRRP